MTKAVWKREYVSWQDVAEHVRWFEAGYGGRLAFKMVVACPAGEQKLKQYWELYFCDDKLEPVALPQRILGSFPTTEHATLAGLFLNMLYRMDALLTEHWQWAEPTFAAKPRVAG